MQVNITLVKEDGRAVTAEAKSWRDAAAEIHRMLGDAFYVRANNPVRLIVLADNVRFRRYDIEFDPKRGTFGHVFPSSWQEIWGIDPPKSCGCRSGCSCETGFDNNSQ